MVKKGFDAPASDKRKVFKITHVKKRPNALIVRSNGRDSVWDPRTMKKVPTKSVTIRRHSKRKKR